jgi:hypothetical protein
MGHDVATNEVLLIDRQITATTVLDQLTITHHGAEATTDAFFLISFDSQLFEQGLLGQSTMLSYGLEDQGTTGDRVLVAGGFQFRLRVSRRIATACFGLVTLLFPAIIFPVIVFSAITSPVLVIPLTGFLATGSLLAWWIRRAICTFFRDFFPAAGLFLKEVHYSE